MRLLERFRIAARTFFQRQRANAELNDELRFHLDQQIAEFRNRGMSEAEARQAALRLFGNPMALHEQARATWSGQWLDAMGRDLRYGVRRLRRSPTFTLTAILVLALGIGANVALFTVVNCVLLRPLAVAHPDRLVRIYEADSRGRFQDSIVAPGSFERWQQQSRSFLHMAMMKATTYDLAGGGQMPEIVQAEQASWQALPMLGVRPMLGRTFQQADDSARADAVVVLSWGLWKRRYGGDPSIVGRTVLVDRRPYVVIGVLPSWFRYPDARPRIWLSLAHEHSPEFMHSVQAHNFDVVGELRSGVTREQATAELDAIQRQTRLNNPDGPVNDAVNLRSILDGQVRGVRSGLFALLAATGCLLMIACLNLANLVVARSASGAHETAIRAALGASRLQLLRGQIAESLLLSTGGGVLGLALAAGALRWFLHTRPELPRAETIHIDGMAVLFATGCILLCGLLAGVLPSFSEGDRNVLRRLQESVRATAGGRARMRRTLLMAEVALTVVLLIAAGLLLKSYSAVSNASMGCDTNHLLTMRLSLPRRDSSAARLAAFYQALLVRIRATPGVTDAAAATSLPGRQAQRDDTYTIREHPPLPRGQVLDAVTVFADPSYFRAMRIPLVAGRSFTEDERVDRATTVVINHALAQQQFAGQNPIGKHIVASIFSPEPTAFEIVGVAADTRELPSASPRPVIYYPLLAGTENSTDLAVRTAADPDSMAEPVKRAIASLDGNVPVSDIMTMDEILGRATSQTSLEATLISAFAALSLLLAAVGLFGVLSFLVAQRTPEIGVRLALGAPRAHILEAVLLDGLRPAALGLVLGLAGAAAVTREIRSLLVETQPLDPMVYLSVCCLLGLVAVVACLAPAWRASRLDPVRALRGE